MLVQVCVPRKANWRPGVVAASREQPDEAPGQVAERDKRASGKGSDSSSVT